MPNEVNPALTPEQWRVLLDRRPVFYNCVEAEYDGETVTLREEKDCLEDGATPRELDITKREKHFVMAVMNATMWNDDPRKITRTDVELLRELEEPLRGTLGGQMCLALAAKLAAKLSALLPPT
jgi:hypothetical protein